jgi:hypothetical protein
LAVRLSRIEDREDVGVLKPGGELDLAKKPLGPSIAATLA